MGIPEDPRQRPARKTACGLPQTRFHPEPRLVGKCPERLIVNRTPRPSLDCTNQFSSAVSLMVDRSKTHGIAMKRKKANRRGILAKCGAKPARKMGRTRDTVFQKKPYRGNRKALQLCRQVQRALIYALGDCNDEVLAGLYVESVDPAPNEKHLMVTVSPLDADVSPEDVLVRLHHVLGKLRSEIAVLDSSPAGSRTDLPLHPAEFAARRLIRNDEAITAAFPGPSPDPLPQGRGDIRQLLIRRS